MTVNVVMLPTMAVWVAGGRVMVGAAAVTVRVAPALVALGSVGFATMTL